MNKIKYICSGLIVIIIACLMVENMSPILKNKQSEKKLGVFFEEENEYDVFFLGSRYAQSAFYPLELWNQYGITSYNLANEGDTMAVSYWELVLALKEKKPKVLVLDVFNSETQIQDVKGIYESIEAFPYSIEKIQAVFDLTKNSSVRMGILFPFSAFHSRWTELTQEDFVTEQSSYAYRGATPSYEFSLREDEENTAFLPKYEFTETDEMYLEKILELCEQHHIRVILANTGYEISHSVGCDASGMLDYNVEYVDFSSLGVINANVDYVESKDALLNASGGKKVTSYIGNLLSEKYELVDKKTDEMYENWNLEYVEYHNYKNFKLFEYAELKKALLAAADHDYSVMIYLRDEAALSQDEAVEFLIKNVFYGYDLKLFENEETLETDYLLVLDREYNQVWECFEKDVQKIETSFGAIDYISNEVGLHDLHVNNSENLLHYFDLYPDAQILLFNNETKELSLITRWSMGNKI